VRLQPCLEGLPGTVEANHRIVRRQAKLRSHRRHRRALDDYASQDRRVLRLELFGLGEHAPAVDDFFVERQLEGIDRGDGHVLLAKLVDEDVAHHPGDPCFRLVDIVDLIGAFERTLQSNVQDIFGVDTRASPSADEREQLGALRHEGAANGRSPSSRVLFRVHAAAIYHHGWGAPPARPDL